MNKIKTEVIQEIEVVQEEVKEEVKAPPVEESRATKAIKNVIDGSWIKNYVLNNLPFIFYIALITILYISNTYYALGTLRHIEKTKNQLKELRYEYVSTKKRMIELSRRAKVIEKLKFEGKDLKESKVPPYKILNNK